MTRNTDGHIVPWSDRYHSRDRMAGPWWRDSQPSDEHIRWRNFIAYHEIMHATCGQCDARAYGLWRNALWGSFEAPPPDRDGASGAEP